MICAVCENEDIRELFTRRYGKIVSRDEESFFRCNNCGLIFISPQPSREALQNYYDQNYYNPWQLDKEEAESTMRNKARTFKNWLNEIEKYFSVGKILDIGCATGFFLEVAQNHGWQPYGVEISEYSSNTARTKFGSRIITGILNDNLFSPDMFDVVTMFDVVEHSFSPVNLLQQAYRVLKPGGGLIISTPGSESFSCRLMGRKWFQFKPEHLYCFNHSVIKVLLQKTGFKLVNIKVADKTLDFRYINDYVKAYHSKVISFLFDSFCRILPKNVKNSPFIFKCGEILVIAKKI